jgi:hypothetical protein
MPADVGLSKLQGEKVGGEQSPVFEDEFFGVTLGHEQTSRVMLICNVFHRNERHDQSDVSETSHNIVGYLVQPSELSGVGAEQGIVGRRRFGINHRTDISLTDCRREAGKRVTFGRVQQVDPLCQSCCDKGSLFLADQVW